MFHRNGDAIFKTRMAVSLKWDVDDSQNNVKRNLFLMVCFETGGLWQMNTCQ